MKTPAAISRTTAFAAHSVDVAGAAGDGPRTHIQLLPIGVINGRDGRGPYRLDDQAHAQRVVDATMATAGATQIAIDYDHQAVFAVVPGVGGTAVAAGWITGLTAQADGIWADVEWTAAASAKLTAREYRYISPYFGFDKATGAITRIWNAGLVNLPNITELAAVASATPEEPDGDDVTMNKIAKALGLGDGATGDEIIAEVTKLKTAAESRVTANATPDPEQFVPMATFIEVRDKLKAEREATLDERATAAVDAATAAGKITPAGRDHALGLYKGNPEAFAAFVGSAPVVLDPGAVDTSGARVDAAAITDEERATAAMFGVSEEAFLASKKQILGAR